MFPIEIPIPLTSNLENKNKIEYSVLTTVNNNSISTLDYFQKKAYYDFSKQIGTTLFLESKNYNLINSESNIDEFDLTIKLPLQKKIIQKGKIAKISTFSPKIVL